MRPIFTSLALLAGLVVSACAENCDTYTVQPYEGDTTKDPASLKRLTAYWAKYPCFKNSDGSEPNMKEQCKDVCFPNASASKDQAITSSQSCVFGNHPWTDPRSGNALLCDKDKTFQGVMMKTGYCKCDLPVLEFAGNFFIEGVLEAGKILEKFICPALQALDVVIGIGMAAIPPPGKAITGGMLAVVRSAKAYKYAYEAQDAAQQWADFFLGGLDFAGQAGCPSLLKPSKQDLITKAFGHLSNTPDDSIPGGMNYDSLPCPAKGCRGCRGPNCRTSPDESNDGSPKTQYQSMQPTKTNLPTNTGSSSETTQSSLGLSSDSRRQQPSTTTISSALFTYVSLSSSSLSYVFSSASSAPAVATLSCKALAALGDEETETPPQTGDMKRSYPIMIRSYPLEKRGEKTGKACGIYINSFSYPPSGSWGKSSVPKKYGFNDVESCDDYNMDNPDANAKYETEHVLEWQIVAGFFNHMNKDSRKDFVHPDPDRKGDKVDFCEYWKESWQFQKEQIMQDPRPVAVVTPRSISKPSSIPRPTYKPDLSLISTAVVASRPRTRPTGTPRIPAGSHKDKPFGLLASAYPHKGKAGAAWVEEFTLLEKTLNGEVKAKVFNADGNTPSIRNAEKMKALVEGRSTEKGMKDVSAFDQGRKAVQRLRQVIGTLSYMQDKVVSKSFADEKNRLGKMIGYIDKELHKTPREYLPNPKEDVSGTKRTAHPWEQQGLEDKWYKYMDDVFERAKTKATKFMDTNLGALKAEWDSRKKTDEFKIKDKDSNKAKAEKEELKKRHKDMLAYIDKTNDEWDKVKNWQKPSNWAQSP